MRRLAILGASARAAAFSAMRAGYEVVTCDLFADADLRACGVEAHQVESYPEGFLGWLSRERFQGWLYTGGLENYPTLVERMASQCDLLGMSGKILREVRSPLKLSRWLGDHFPETQTTPKGLPTDGSWLVKSYRGAGGSGVRSLTESELDSTAKSPKRYYQRRVEGLPASAVFVGDGEQTVLLGISEQLVGEAWTGASPFDYCGSIAGINLPEAVRRAIKQIGQKLTARFQLQGLFGIDFMIDDTQVWVLEVNPRWTASVELIEQTYRFNAIEYHLAACLEGKLPKPPAIESFGRILGKAIVFASQPATASKKFTSDCLAQRGSLDSPELADIPNFGTSLEQGNPVCTVFASGVDRETVVNQLREKTNAVLDKLSDPTHA